MQLVVILLVVLTNLNWIFSSKHHRTFETRQYSDRSYNVDSKVGVMVTAIPVAEMNENDVRAALAQYFQIDESNVDEALADQNTNTTVVLKSLKAGSAERGERRLSRTEMEGVFSEMFGLTQGRKMVDQARSSSGSLNAASIQNGQGNGLNLGNMYSSQNQVSGFTNVRNDAIPNNIGYAQNETFTNGMMGSSSGGSMNFGNVQQVQGNNLDMGNSNYASRTQVKEFYEDGQQKLQNSGDLNSARRGQEFSSEGEKMQKNVDKAVQQQPYIEMVDRDTSDSEEIEARQAIDKIINSRSQDTERLRSSEKSFNRNSQGNDCQKNSDMINLLKAFVTYISVCHQNSSCDCYCRDEK